MLLVFCRHFQSSTSKTIKLKEFISFGIFDPPVGENFYYDYTCVKQKIIWQVGGSCSLKLM